MWDMYPDIEALVAQAKAGVPRCLTSEEREAFFLPVDPPDWYIEMKKKPYDGPEWKQWLDDKRAGNTRPLPEARWPPDDEKWLGTPESYLKPEKDEKWPETPESYLTPEWKQYLADKRAGKFGPPAAAQ
jgi:hypothetical protein